MKRKGHLIETTASAANVYLGWRESRKRKPKNQRRREEMKRFKDNLLVSLNNVQYAIETGEWNMSADDYGLFYRWQCGKLREICYNKSYFNNVVMHCIMNVDGKILEDTLIADTFSGIKGRGPVVGVEKMKEYLSEYPDDVPIYVLKIDMRHYYDSIIREVLKGLISRKIKDRKALNLHFVVIDSSPRKGIPKGNLPSQTYGNLYLSPLDHYIKEQKGFKHYARYCDDIVVLSSDKSALVALLADIKEFIKPYGLEIKSNAQVFPIERYGIDFIGYVFRRHEVRLRKRNERKLRRAARMFKEEPTKKNYKTLAAYWGLVKHISRPDALWNAVVGKPIKELWKTVRDSKEAA
jgi:hypothetical protein